LLVSALVAAHLTAVFVAPWRLSTPPALPPGYIAIDQQGNARPELPPPPMDHPVWQRPALVSALYDALNGYMNLAFINHGYEFFAPDPAPSQLVGITVYDENDEMIDSVVLPDRQKQWPRLFYHRHMMLASQASDLNLGRADAYGLYAQHLMRRFNGVRATVERPVHMLLGPEMVRAGRHINAKDTYDNSAPMATYYRQDDPAAVETLPIQEGSQVRIPGEAR
jgi:hypothetical protein